MSGTYYLLAGLFGVLAEQAQAQTIRGTVRDLQSGVPLRGVGVSLLNHRDSIIYTVRARSDGSFVLSPSGPGTYSVGLRAVGYAPMLTTPFPLDSGVIIALDFEMAREVTKPDTVGVPGSTRPTNIARGSTHFLAQYRDSRGMFFSGAEMLEANQGVAEYVSRLPGFRDFAGGKGRAANECDLINAELKGSAQRLSTTSRSPTNQVEMREDLCSLRDEAGRSVFPVDAPCVTTQVDRIGLVKRLEGMMLVVHRSQRAFVPLGELSFNEAESFTPTEYLVNLARIIAVEVYQRPGDVPPKLRIRATTPEVEAVLAKCAHIQMWTRSAW